MLKKSDPYTYSTLIPLWDGTNNQIGTAYLEYQATRYDNVQVEDTSSISTVPNSTSQFFLSCTQTINIYNNTTYTYNTSSTGNNPNPPSLDLAPPFSNYPVLVNTTIQPKNTSGVTFQALSYSPLTVNSTVQSSQANNNSNGTSNGSSSTNTVGSSNSTTNSYGVSVSVSATAGLFDASVTGSVTGDYNNSNTSSSDYSNSTGTDSSRNSSQDSSSSASMSIKDWGSYACVINTNNEPPAISWTFGQEYPWDAIQCQILNDSSLNPANSNQAQVSVPIAMSSRLYDVTSGTQLPPSHLSLFGVNFVTNAMWLVTIDNATFTQDTSGDPFDISINHLINYVSASHSPGFNNSEPVVNIFMDSMPTTLGNSNQNSQPVVTNQTNLDLWLMALDPIGYQTKPAIIGFIPNKFIIQPEPIPTSANFKIISTNNNLQVLDTSTYNSGSTTAGFSCSANFMKATFDADTPSLQMTIYFKVVDTVSDYTLYMKHWVIPGSEASATNGINLNFNINGNAVGSPYSFTKYISEPLSQGGDNNLLSISLRKQDFTNDDYHDYLQLGLNSIQITIGLPPNQSPEECNYAIRALSIEKNQ